MDFTFNYVFSIEGLTTLAMLILLQAVLGFDNLLYISIESKRAPEEKQQWVRKMGIGLAVALRLILLFVIMRMVESFKEPLFNIDLGKFFHGDFTLESIITLVGGVFILYTALKEVLHLIAIQDISQGVATERKQKSAGAVIFWIVLMNLIFSFDSILSAMALTKNFYVMGTAIVISGILMIWLADHVADFLKKNRMYEVLGLFILFIVGVMLLGQGGEQAKLEFFTYQVEKMTKTTFYFSIGVLVLIDIVQTKYQKKLLAMKKHEVES